MTAHFFTDKQVKVRKSHRCVWCGEDIPNKSNAQYRSYIFDGVFQFDWMHPECYSAMMNDWDEGFDEGFLPGEFERGSAENAN